MNNGWMGKGDGVGGGSRGRGRGRGDLTRVKPPKPAKEVSDEKRSRRKVALFRVIFSIMKYSEYWRIIQALVRRRR